MAIVLHACIDRTYRTSRPMNMTRLYKLRVYLVRIGADSMYQKSSPLIRGSIPISPIYNHKEQLRKEEPVQKESITYGCYKSRFRRVVLQSKV